MRKLSKTTTTIKVVYRVKKKTKHLLLYDAKPNQNKKCFESER